MSTPFASTADTAEKRESLEVLAGGVYALTAEGDPNVGAIEGDDFLVCIEARATPAAARDWLARLRQHTAKAVAADLFGIGQMRDDTDGTPRRVAKRRVCEIGRCIAQHLGGAIRQRRCQMPDGCPRSVSM